MTGRQVKAQVMRALYHAEDFIPWRESVRHQEAQRMAGTTQAALAPCVVLTPEEARIVTEALAAEDMAYHSYAFALLEGDTDG